jgi:hypothetical protein
MAQTLRWQTGWLTLLVATLILTTLKSTPTLMVVMVVVVPLPTIKAYKVATASEHALPTKVNHAVSMQEGYKRKDLRAIIPLSACWHHYRVGSSG